LEHRHYRRITGGDIASESCIAKILYYRPARIMTRKPRVLLISTQPFFQWRGSPIRVKFNLLALESLGFQVDLLAPPIGADDEEVRSRVHRVWRLPGVTDIPIGPSLPKAVFDGFLLLFALTFALRCRYDVIHGTEEGGAIALLVARVTRAKCIYEKHSDPTSYRKGSVRNLLMAVYRRVEGFVARHADAVVCTGPGLERQARQYAPNTQVYRISDIPSSLQEPSGEEIDQARGQIETDDENLLVTYVGSFALYQGIELLFSAIPIVLNANRRVRFVIIGGKHREIETYGRQLGVYAERVNFLGRIDPDRLPAYLAASDIVLAPRKSGINTPLKLLDYFKANAAIVATDTEANRLILDGDCARLAAFDAPSFARAIVDLAEDSSERQRLADNGRARFEAEFTFEKFSRRLGEVYEFLVPRQS
jgi:glycosyltransferase involved in cell wall biosynthesis